MHFVENLAVEGMQLNGKSISEEREGGIRKRVLVVAEGYDVSVPEGRALSTHVLRLESKLRDVFSSCGKIKSVCIPYAPTIARHGYIDILGEGAEEKALQLSGSEMDGHKLVVTAPLHPLKRARIRALRSSRLRRSKTVAVRGYDTSLPNALIKSALGKHFSSCGEVMTVDFTPKKRSSDTTRQFAYVDIYGLGAKEKALQLSGSDMGGFKLVVANDFCVRPVDRPPSPPFHIGLLPLSERLANPTFREEIMKVWREKMMKKKKAQAARSSLRL